MNNAGEYAALQYDREGRSWTCSQALSLSSSNTTLRTPIMRLPIIELLARMRSQSTPALLLESV